jgi:hypothetical protein
MATIERERKTKCLASWQADARQIAAAQAASAAMENSSPQEQVVAVARAAYECAGTEPAPAPAPERDPAALQSVRDYLIAVANVGSGDFESLSLPRLRDAACVVRAPVVAMDEWLQRRDGAIKGD